MSSQQNADPPPRPRAAATTSTRQSETAAKAPIDSEARARLVANLTDREIAELKKYLTPELNCTHQHCRVSSAGHYDRRPPCQTGTSIGSPPQFQEHVEADTSKSA